MAFGTDESVLFREVSLIQGCPYREVPYNSCAIIDILYYLSSYQYYNYYYDIVVLGL